MSTISLSSSGGNASRLLTPSTSTPTLLQKASSPLLPKSAVLSEDQQSESSSVSISDRAKAANDALTKMGVGHTGTAYSQQFFDKIDAMSVSDKTAAYTQAAMEVSADQGLKPGQYDFSKMTKGQALVVGNYLKLTGDPDAQGIIDAVKNSSTASTDWTDQTINVTKLVSDAADADTSGSGEYKKAADLMDKLSTTWKALNSASTSSASVQTNVDDNGVATTYSVTYTN